MDTENIYMNFHIRTPPLKSPQPKAETQPVYKNLRILYALLLLFALMLVASLTATVVLYSWESACLRLHGTRLQQRHLEKLNASYQELQHQYRTIITLISEGWRLHNGNIYYFSSVKKPWAEAQQFCLSKNSNLTSVTSKEEQEFLSQGTGADYWIGLTDQGSEGVWHWVDGNPYNQSVSEGFWRLDQPDNWDQGKGFTEDCVHLITGNLRAWNDANCTIHHQWICKSSLKSRWLTGSPLLPITPLPLARLKP
ncbi:C-type lectin domain family 4 member F-like [Antechinus flavipes]|uniref:C-type lectin domain family 4 member F-like n=1 Tax=Antechinus flavipes TaxID=38775 RepID=UPI0022364972|nr:C-type lectin domain family 4 member F-like [Antechinus flavipes]